METKNVLHMTKGDGEFSYAHNSNYQNRVFSHVVKPLLETTIRSIILKSTDNMRPCKVNVADLGCGVGPTPISLISTVITTVHKMCKEMKYDEIMPQIQIFMSDLPSNDFNLLFKDVEKLQHGLNESIKNSCFVMGVPGSFYGRLFPSNTLQLVTSNYAIHWLSQVPKGLSNGIGTSMNKGHIVAAETSHPEALRAYHDQFQQDFTTFLNCRSHEVVANGYMLLATFCRPSMNPTETLMFNLLYQALACLVSKGVIKEEKLDSFNVPVYFPCKEEIREIVSKEGSFAIEHLEVMHRDVGDSMEDAKWRAGFIAKITRAVTEALISYHFGAQIWDHLYVVLYQVILNQLESSVTPSDVFDIVVVLRKYTLNKVANSELC